MGINRFNSFGVEFAGRGRTRNAGGGGRSTPIAFTSAQDGDWNDLATWTDGTDYPRIDGDTVTIAAGHEITIPSSLSVTCGAVSMAAGTNTSTNRTILTINGIFTMAGDVTMAGITSLNMGPGATLDLGGNNVIRTATDVRHVFAGTSEARCTIRSTGGRGAFTMTGSNAYLILATWDYVDCSGLADSVLGRSNASAVTQHFEYCSFSDMESFYAEGTAIAVDAGFEFNHNDIRNPHIPTGSDYQPIFIHANQALGTAPREFIGNTCSGGARLGEVYFQNCYGVTTTGNVMDRFRFRKTGGGGQTVTDCFFSNRNSDNDAFFNSAHTFGAVQGNYCYVEGNTHALATFGAVDADVLDNVFEQGGGLSGVGINWILFATASGKTINVKNNLGIGVGFGSLVSATGACSFTLLDISRNTLYVDNENADQTAALKYPPLLLTEQSGAFSGTVNVYNNLHYDSDEGATTQDLFIDLVSSTVDQIDLLDYNNGYPNAPLYDANVVVTAGVGPNDLNVDPVFADSTRGLADWDSSLGGPGTAANAISELLKLNGYGGTWNSSYNVADLLAYVYAGFQPTGAGATALNAAGYAGGDIGFRTPA